jgi:hypothetical protein
MYNIISLRQTLKKAGSWRLDQRDCFGADTLDAIRRCEDHGWIGRRTHFYPGGPKEGEPAYELTDSGIEKLRRLSGNKAADAALELRQWYRVQAALV